MNNFISNQILLKIIRINLLIILIPYLVLSQIKIDSKAACSATKVFLNALKYSVKKTEYFLEKNPTYFKDIGDDQMKFGIKYDMDSIGSLTQYLFNDYLLLTNTEINQIGNIVCSIFNLEAAKQLLNKSIPTLKEELRSLKQIINTTEKTLKTFLQEHYKLTHTAFNEIPNTEYSFDYDIDDSASKEVLKIAVQAIFTCVESILYEIELLRQKEVEYIKNNPLTSSYVVRNGKPDYSAFTYCRVEKIKSLIIEKKELYLSPLHLTNHFVAILEKKLDQLFTEHFNELNDQNKRIITDYCEMFGHVNEISIQIFNFILRHYSLEDSLLNDWSFEVDANWDPLLKKAIREPQIQYKVSNQKFEV